jgi:hypothetical protein
MGSGDEKGVPLEDRAGVEEPHDVGFLEHEMGRGVTGHDPAEQAVHPADPRATRAVEQRFDTVVGMTQAAVPPGWPVEVRPAGAEYWQDTAATWLLDIGPPELRSYPVLRRHAVVLARFAAVHTDATLDALRRAVAEARTSLRDVVGPETVEQAVQAWESEVARLVARRRAVDLVEQALRGRQFRARL